MEFFVWQFGFGFNPALDPLRWLLLGLSAALFVLSIPFVCKQIVAQRGLYHLLSLGLLLCVSGVFLAGNFLALFVCFELMSLASVLWIYYGNSPAASAAGFVYLCFALCGGLLLLAALCMLSRELGSLSFALLRECALQDPGKIYPAAACLLAGFGIKAGMVPLHVWMQGAYGAAPAPAAGLLSAILSKCGIFGMLLTLHTLLPNRQLWGGILLGLGFLTLLCGGVQALFACAVRPMLAASSLSQMGFMILSLSLFCRGQEAAALGSYALALQMLSHALAKCILFWEVGERERAASELVCGSAVQQKRQGGLPAWTWLPACISLAGVPLSMGYAAKTLLHEGLAAMQQTQGEMVQLLRLVEPAFLLGAALSVGYALRLALLLWRGRCVCVQRSGKGPCVAAALLTGVLLLLGLPPVSMAVARFAGLGEPAHAPEILSLHAVLPFLQAAALGSMAAFVAHKIAKKRPWKAGGAGLLSIFYRPLLRGGLRVATMLAVACDALPRRFVAGFCACLHRQRSKKKQSCLPPLLWLQGQFQHSLSWTLLLFVWGFCVMIALLCFAFLRNEI